MNKNRLNISGLAGVMPAAAMTLCLAVLTGCGSSSSDVMPQDGRDVVDPDNSSGDIYHGVAANGYLRDAIVWLDINDNKELDEGEPETRSGEQGRFALDLTDINDARREANLRVLDPRDYPLMLLAIPGETIDETRIVDGNTAVATVDRHFFLSAPADVQKITPLTTLVKIQQELTLGPQISGTSTDVIRAAVNQAHNGLRSTLGQDINFLEDYLTSENTRLEKYAQSVTEYIKLQTPGFISSRFRADQSDTYLTGEEWLLIGRVLLSSVPGLWDQLDTIAAETGGNYEGINASTQLTYSLVDVNFDDPYVVRKATVYKSPDAMDDGELPVTAVERESYVSTTVDYSYNTLGGIEKIESDGFIAFVPEFQFTEAIEPGWFFENFQYWGTDGVVDQVLYLERSGLGPVTRIEFDSAHPLDHEEGLTKAEARDLATNPDLYPLDGLPEATAEYDIQSNRVNRIDVVEGGEAFIYTFQFDSERRVQSMRKLSGQTVISEWQYEYNVSKNLPNATALLLMRITKYQGSAADNVVDLIFEVFAEEVIVGSELVTRPDYVFVANPAVEAPLGLLRYDYEYHTPVTILRDFMEQNRQVDPEDQVAIQEIRDEINAFDSSLLALEGEANELYVGLADANGLPIQGRLNVLKLASVLFKHEKLSTFVYDL
ncbi:MAG: hypothetical protein MI864_25595 [Pseudomonadales bacterium]|nr:hypothetical protein [Pseudomonadales bacterium]